MLPSPDDSRGISSCPSFDRVVEMLQTERYAEVVREYGSTLEDDPAYLVYHHTSTALRLQFLLKDEDFPALCIGDCIDQRLGECCVVAALREAIRRGEVGVRDRK